MKVWPIARLWLHANKKYMHRLLLGIKIVLPINRPLTAILTAWMKGTMGRKYMELRRHSKDP